MKAGWRTWLLVDVSPWPQTADDLAPGVPFANDNFSISCPPLLKEPMSGQFEKHCIETEQQGTSLRGASVVGGLERAQVPSEQRLLQG